MKKFYLAYGSNLNVKQMQFRCPDARIVGTAEIPNYQLLFKGSKTGSYLTIEPKQGCTVPAVVWSVSERDELALDRYEVYVDERNTAQEEDVTDAEYLEILKSSGAEHLVQPKTASESAIAAFSTQYQYNKDYFVGDYVTVEQKRFGLIQPRIQLIGMVESLDQNGRSLTPTFKETE